MDKNVGKTTPCETCGIAVANQHSIRESAKCDGIRNGYLNKDGSQTGKGEGA